MDISEDEFVNTITNKLVESNLAIFAGAGLSMQAGLPGWRELLRSKAEEIRLDVDKETDLITVAQYFVNENAQMKTLLSDHILSKLTGQVTPSSSFSILARLPISTYWTTNYDTLIETALQEARKHPRVVYGLDQLTMTKQGSDATVYKMHGDINNPNTIVITRDDYERYSSERALLLNILSTALLEKTFLFLGFSFTDPNFNYVASQLRVALQDSVRPHYWIEAKVSKTSGEADDAFAYRKTKQQLHISDLKRFGVQCYLVDCHEEIEGILLKCEERYRRTASRTSSVKTMIAPDEVIYLSDDQTQSRIVVKSPRDGTFYESEGNDNLPLVTVGDYVEVNQALCLLEFDKSFVLLRAGHPGYVEAVMPKDSAKVAHNQELFTLLPVEAPANNPLYYQKTSVGGSFYRASSPNDQPFVREGHLVSKGDELCILERMKRYHRVAAEVSGVIIKIIPENGAAVSDGGTMFIIDPIAAPGSVPPRQFRVQNSKHSGRFFTEPACTVGTSVLRGARVGEMQQGSKTTDVFSEYNGRIRGYFVRAGEHVEVDQPLLSIYPSAIGDAYRVQLARSEGVFQARVKVGEYVEVGQTVALIRGRDAEFDVAAEHAGAISEVVPSDGVQVQRNALLFKYEAS
ncbi:MAG: biotin/lipoyl-containing protein [Pseudomonadota bacterium]